MIDINQKGNVALIVVMLASALIGLVVLSGFTDGFCNCLDGTDITQTNTLNDTWYNNTCDGDKCETEYYLTCNGTELEVATEYEIDSCNFMVTNASFNGTTCVLEYTYESDYYGGDGILGTIICLLPVLIAIGILVAAIAWASLG